MLHNGLRWVKVWTYWDKVSKMSTFNRDHYPVVLRPGPLLVDFMKHIYIYIQGERTINEEMFTSLRHAIKLKRHRTFSELLLLPYYNDHQNTTSATQRAFKIQVVCPESLTYLLMILTVLFVIYQCSWDQ